MVGIPRVVLGKTQIGLVAKPLRRLQFEFVVEQWLRRRGENADIDAVGVHAGQCDVRVEPFRRHFEIDVVATAPVHAVELHTIDRVDAEQVKNAFWQHVDVGIDFDVSLLSED